MFPTSPRWHLQCHGRSGLDHEVPVLAAAAAIAVVLVGAFARGPTGSDGPRAGACRGSCRTGATAVSTAPTHCRAIRRRSRISLPTCASTRAPRTTSVRHGPGGSQNAPSRSAPGRNRTALLFALFVARGVHRGLHRASLVVADGANCDPEAAEDNQRARCPMATRRERHNRRYANDGKTNTAPEGRAPGCADESEFKHLTTLGQYIRVVELVCLYAEVEPAKLSGRRAVARSLRDREDAVAAPSADRADGIVRAAWRK